jgi:hypothetical protein
MEALLLPLPLLESQLACHAVLAEAKALFHASPLTSSRQHRLDLLLFSYFQDNALGASFRSMTCYGVDHSPVSIQQFNDFIIRPFSNFEFELSPPRTVPVSICFQSLSKEAQRERHCNTLDHAHATITFVLQHVLKEHYPGQTDLVFLATTLPLSWKNAIINNPHRSQLSVVDIPPLLELEDRIRQSIDFSLTLRITSPRARFFSVLSGSTWQETPVIPEIINYEEIYLQGCSDFPAHLASLLGTDKYLDELAGVDVGHSHPEVEARFQKMYEQAPARHVEGHNLFMGKDGVKVGGTVLALHQYLSPAFLAYFVVDLDASCAYMKEERSGHKKDRIIRVASMDHVDTKPTWLQFGDSNVYLYLSQRASAAEEKWLSIVNYMMNLLVDFVNARIKTRFGNNVSTLCLMRPRDYRVAVGSAGNPKANANLGKHGDGKNGIVIVDDPMYSLFQLMVPTLCLQNYAHANTSIYWAPNCEPKYIAAEVKHECVLIHSQLLGVNEKFHHWVCSSLSLLALIDPFISFSIVLSSFL